VLITEPARQAGRQAGRQASVTVAANSGGSAPRSPAVAASCCSKRSPPPSPPTAPAAARPRPPAGHTPPASEPGTEGQPRDRSDRRVQPGVGLDRRRHLQPPRPAHRANQPGIQQAPRTRCTCFPATSLTHYRRQQPRLRPRRLAPPRLARPVRATSSRATSDGRVHLTISYPRARPSQQLLRRWGISTARPWRAFDGARTPDRRRWCWCWLVTTAADHQQEQHGAKTAQELGSLALTDVT